ncbi:hypothetical protein PENSTE_c025G04547 [Penicillium steckii]|uniref:Uncharacterized protein n=1 Tax=Penicillium steckii TaxID=303698 RepID=A0A1V6SQ77_9EURO|nr:hypothetical protein PENSTE_c025G04547 [Penicillium steckii]
MFFNKNGLALSLLSLLQGTSASYNPIGGPITGDITNYESVVSGTPSATKIFADIVAPSGSTAVVEFVKSTPEGISSPGASSTPSVPPCRGDPCTVTLTPVQFAPSVVTWIQHLTTTVTVPEASTPVIHFSAIQLGVPASSQSAAVDGSQAPGDASTAAPNTSPSQDPTTSQPQSGAPAGEIPATPNASPSASRTPSRPPQSDTPTEETSATPDASPSQPTRSGAPAGDTATASGNAPGKTSGKPQTPGSGAPNTPGSSTPYVVETSSNSASQSNTDSDASSTSSPNPSPSPTNSQPGSSRAPTSNNSKNTPRPSGHGSAGSTTTKPASDSLTSAAAETDSEPNKSTTADAGSESTTTGSPVGPSGSGSAGSSGHGTSGKPPGSKTSGRPAGSTSKAGGSTGSGVSSSTTASNSGSSIHPDDSNTSEASSTPSSSGTPKITESGLSDDPAGSTPAGGSTASNASGSASATESTPLTTPGPSQTSSASQSSDSVSSSASLQDAPDSEDISSMLSTLTGTSSSDVAALLSAEETRTPATTEAWEDLMSEAPTATTSSDDAAQTTEGAAMAGWLTKFNDNVQSSDLKDKDTYDKVKDNLSKTNDDVKNYVEHRKSSGDSEEGSSDDSCGSGEGLFAIFKAASCFVNKASDEIENGSKNIGNLINSGWDLTSQGMSEIEKELPDVDDITPEIEQEFKDNVKHFSEITESLENLEKENEKDDDHTSESQSQSSTSSSSSTSSDSTTSTTATETTSTGTSTSDSYGITCSPGCSACQAAETSADAAAASSWSSHSASFSASLSSKKKRGLNVAQQTPAPSINKRAGEEEDPLAYLDDPNRSGLEAINFEFYGSRFEAFEDAILAEESDTSEASVKVKHTVLGSMTSSRFINFGKKIARVWVEELTGCTGVGIVSEQGAWLGHFWEDPTMQQDSKDTPAWKEQVIKVLKETDDDSTTPPYPLGATGKALHPDNNVRIFIMTPAEDGSPKYSDSLGWLEDLLTGDGAPWAGVEITRHLYDKPKPDTSGIDEINGENQEETDEKRRDELEKRMDKALAAYATNSKELNGRMMIEFAPRQTIKENGDEHDLLDPAVAIYRVWMASRDDRVEFCPHENQQSGDGNNQKRAAACSLSSSTSSSTSSDALTSTDSTSTDSASTDTSSGSTTAATTTSSPMCELQVIGSSYSICSCSSTMGSHTVSHAMLKPTSTDCGDINTFPMTSFIQVPTPTQTTYFCSNTPKDVNGNEGAFCQCSSKMTKTDATTAETTSTLAVVSLPYVMGSQTVLEQCADITDFPDDGISVTTGNTETQPTRTFTDYTSTDFGNNDKVYVYTAAAEYYDYNKYGDPDITGPATWTTGIGDPVKEFLHDYTTTNDGGTVYAYAEATGDGDGEVAAAGSPTATSLPEPTHNCVKFVVPAPGDVYNSATEQYLFTMWGIDHWAEAKDIKHDIEGVLRDAGVESDISVEADTGRWGTVAMWNNGREYEMTKDLRKALKGLGMGKSECKWILKTGFDVNFPVKDSAVEEMDWIEENHPDAIKSPYPLED